MSSAEDLVTQGKTLFNKRQSLLSLWQELAENFYPERADFTSDRSLGTEFASDLANTAPVLFRRDLANSLGGMLRPTNKQWFHTRTSNYEDLDTESLRWLERAEQRQRRAMYVKDAQFRRAMTEHDNDLATFGQAVLQLSLNRKRTQLLYRCRHLRDCAWLENDEGVIDCVYRKWKMRALDAVAHWPETAGYKLRELASKEPYTLVELWHCVKPTPEDYKPEKGKLKTIYKSYVVYAEEATLLEEIGVNFLGYVIPRWQTVSGSQYAFSPASITALPDARTLQAMTVTLLEAGEKSVTPPLLGVQEALRSDVNVMAGGITWVDREYDERLGEVLRPLTIDKSGIPLGMELAAGIEARLRDAWLISKLNMPPVGGPDMTAYEVGQRVQEWIRQALPLVEPIETESNGGVCDATFDILMAQGVFGVPQDRPATLQDTEVVFTFESPLHDALERVKAQKYMEALSLLANATAADPSTAHILDHTKAVREALNCSGVPAEWMRTTDEVRELADADRQAQQTAELLAQLQQGADVARTLGTTPTPSGTLGAGQ